MSKKLSQKKIIDTINGLSNNELAEYFGNLIKEGNRIDLRTLKKSNKSLKDMPTSIVDLSILNKYDDDLFKEFLNSRNINEILELLFMKEHYFIDYRGKALDKKIWKNYCEYKEKLIEHSNRKLVALKKYPPFNQAVDGLRSEFKIEQGEEAKLNTYLAFSGSRLGYKDFCEMNDPFIADVSLILPNYRILKKDLEMIFKSLIFYILFNRYIKNIEFDELKGSQCVSQNVDDDTNLKIIRKVTREIVSEREVKEAIGIIRNKYNIKISISVFNISQTCQRYAKYLYRSYRWLNVKDNDRMFDFYKKVSGIFELCKEFLSVDNILDYLSITNYIIYGEELSNKNLYDFYKEIVAKLFTGEQIMEKGNLNDKSLYIEVPRFITEEYMDKLSPLFVNRAIEHYKLARSIWRQFPDSYYSNKYVAELAEKYCDLNFIRYVSNEVMEKIINEIRKNTPNFLPQEVPKTKGENLHIGDDSKDMLEYDAFEDNKERVIRVIEDFKEKWKNFEGDYRLR